jgi:hypothetical protein
MPLSRPVPSWTISDASPWTSVGARTIEAPYATPIDCMPRHTPSSGMCRSAATLTASIETPASSGSPGPGEMTIPRRSAPPSSARASTSARDTASLRTTRTSAPAAWRACTRLNVNES